MGGPTVEVKKEPCVEINKEALENAVNNVLKTYFPRLESTSNARVQFYNKFQRGADEYDRDFLDKHKADLDTTLIFAALFSAVASAFIIAFQTQIQPDYNQLSYDVLVTIADSKGLKVATKPSSDSPWTGPDSTLIHIQSSLFSSLAASLLAAFIAMLGKQWLNRYSKVDMRGSLIDRSRDRQRKMDGMAAWGFDFVMEGLPLMLQAALLLLGYALGHYLFTINKTVAAVIIGFTGAGLLFYAIIALAAILSYNCPYQTPLSLIIRFIIRLVKEREKHLEKSEKWFRRMFSRMKKVLRSDHSQGPGAIDTQNRVELAMTGPSNHPPALFHQDADWDGYVLDSNCIAWMFTMSMDPDVILDIIKFIPEIIWHTGIQTAPLEHLYDTVVECFDPSDRSVMIPKFKYKAYHRAKALLHVAVQRKCMGNELDEEAFESISRQHIPIDYEGDPDLESTLGMIDRIFGPGNLEPIRWQKYSFTDSHRDWMGRILLYRAWDSLRKGGALPGDIREFVRHSLQVKRPPPAPILMNSLLMVGLVLGIKLRFDDQQATDKSLKFRSQIDRIYEKLLETFRGPTADSIDRAVEAMRLISPFSQDIALKSYKLFQVIMQPPVLLACPEEKKWEASRLAMDGAYKWDEVLPPVGNPQDVLTFLNYHFSSPAQYQDEPIQNALRALGSIPSHVMNEAFRGFNDQTRSSFVRGIRHVFQKNRPLKLRKAAFFFLPIIADSLFNPSPPVMEDEEMRAFCVDWASAADDIGHSDDVRKVSLVVLFSMINSPHWRPHIVAETWTLLQDFISNPDDSQPPKQCLDNPQLIDAIPNVGKPSPRAHWLAILWLRYEQLDPSVRKKLEMATREVPRTDLGVCQAAVNSELEKAEKALLKYNAWNPDPDIYKRKESLKWTQQHLLNLKR